VAVDYINLAAVADRLISENGTDVTLVKVNRALADGSQPWKGGNVPTGSTTKLVKGVIVEYDLRDIDGEQIQRGDRQLVVSENSASPEDIRTFDNIVIGTETWKIILVQVVEPGDTRILYSIGIRFERVPCHRTVHHSDGKFLGDSKSRDVTVNFRYQSHVSILPRG